ncbi:excalibur calcium-binding domain-containing protein [Tsukamurella paurometabola]|uniref:Excalibur calcium-binding domain n=1 Tax=Tsukamurella paurometabola TaxID=2061 RepID=A0A3P8L7T3_TSUPA|nr:excalibur calcium-binding domain-containing protein [Tsukamurella paurometabola]MBS4103949.1 excalibur calcium-binding domain-containing protein [Tsukamurella paurometabola]UEA82625.1 excalibur calcium-binding domain-containing protein [Tsukamurella paurometabola]VDR39691.1 Excalibur calcium-binding domain [Tsukamurella paurometabola]
MSPTLTRIAVAAFSLAALAAPAAAANADPSYKNCTEVRQAGKAPILKGQPGYGSHLDRDGDGIACEVKKK